MPACKDSKMAASSPSEASASSSNENASQPPAVAVQNDSGEKVEKSLHKFDDSTAKIFPEEMYTKMLNPMLNEMEKNVSNSSKILDRINKQMEAERRERVKKRLSSHIPEALQGGGESTDSVLRKVEQLIFFAEVEGTDEVELQEHVRLADLDPVSNTSLVANSLKAYLTTLGEPELKRVATKINSDCQLWLSRLFRFKDSCVMYHDDEYEGLVRICRLALYNRYPKYATDGFDALYSRPPVIYLSAAARLGLGHYLCLQLGLPLSCICTVPCNTVFGASSKMDVAMLEKLIQDDIAAAKTPLLLLAFAGTPAVGHVDNIQRLQEVCKTNNIWLHVEGNYLATLTLFSVPTEVSSAQSGDSITITPSAWLGIPGLPNATLFKTSDATLMHAAGLNTFNPALKLNCLPYWMCLLTLGHQGIIGRLSHCCDLAKLLYDKLDPITSIKQISREKKDPAKKKEYKSLIEFLSKAISALLLFEMASPTVVFRYAEDIAAPGAIVAPYAQSGEDQSDRSEDSIYYDALNIWLAEALQTSDPKVPVDTIEVEKEGVCIRYCPLENAQALGTSRDDMEHFAASLISNLSVLNASTKHRKRFQSIVSAQPNLRLMHLHNWAGLGAVSYIPDMFLEKAEFGHDDLLTINNLNAEVVHQLKAKDTAFSMGHTDDGTVCVKFGLITQDTDVEELVELVQSLGREVEESSKFLEHMSDVIRKGIEEANHELEKENIEKLQHEGVLRQLPMVGSVLNWFSPIKEEVKGRSFNLTSGRIMPTTDTYRYHMQIQEEANNAAAAAAAAARARTSSTSSSRSGSERVKDEGQGEGGSTTAGQVKAQLISQTPPATPTTESAPPVQGQHQGVNSGAQPSQQTAAPASPTSS